MEIQSEGAGAVAAASCWFCLLFPLIVVVCRALFYLLFVHFSRANHSIVVTAYVNASLTL